MKEFVKIPTAVIRVPVLSQDAVAGFGKQVTDDSFDSPEIKWFYEDQVPDDIDYGIRTKKPNRLAYMPSKYC